jgi:hypothetical protein
MHFPFVERTNFGKLHTTPQGEFPPMQTVRFVHWEDGGAWIGYLQDYPDYWTQGETLDDLKDHLKDLFYGLTSGDVTACYPSP